MGIKRLIFFFTVAILIAYGIKAFRGNHTQIQSRVSNSNIKGVIPSLNIRARVVHVIDGDTIKILTPDGEDIVRLIGIDSPETVDPRKSVQCFGHEASYEMSQLVFGKSIFLEADTTQGDRDKYGRLLRFVFLDDGTDINKEMIEMGYAFEYTYNLPYKYRDSYAAAEKYARANRLGLWNSQYCGVEYKYGKWQTTYAVAR